MMKKHSINVVDIQNTEHYQWGHHNDGWHFLKSDNLSVIRERMLTGTKEQWHFHQQAAQFFYIIRGEATFEVGDKSYTVSKDQGIHIPPMTPHRISNKGDQNLEFILISHPNAHQDRINIEDETQ